MSVRMRGASAVPMRKRALHACGVVLALGALALAVGGIGNALKPSVLQEAVNPALWEDGRAEAMLQLGDGAPGGAVAAPDSFEEELLPLGERVDARFDEQGGVAGFTVEGPAGEVFAAVSDELAAKGWAGVSSGAAACGTFVKNEGRYHWAFVSCVQVEAATCVVVQVAPEEEEGI